MNDFSPGEVERRFGELVDGFGWSFDPGTDAGLGEPAILVKRLRAGDEVPVGARARFLMTTYDGDGELVGYGWRTDLRIHSPAICCVMGLNEPGVQLVDEREHYTGESHTLVTVDISRVWVEELVRVPAAQRGDDADDWWRCALDDPNQPRVERLHRAPGRPHLIGSRLVRELGEGRYDGGLRAVSSALMTDDGNLVVAVVDEGEWYRWSKRTYTAEDRPVGHVRTGELWVE